MSEPSVSRRAFQLVAVSTLPLPFLATYAFGSPIVALLPSNMVGALPTLLRVLVYLLVLLMCVVVWAVLLLPLRKRAGFTPIAAELREIQRGGFRESIAREQKALKARAAVNDPSYHSTFALVGAVLGLAAGGLSWALWNDGYVMFLALGGAVVCPILALYHSVQWLRFRR